MERSARIRCQTADLPLGRTTERRLELVLAEAFAAIQLRCETVGVDI